MWQDDCGITRAGLYMCACGPASTSSYARTRAEFEAMRVQPIH